jgi:hypothetical protein
MTPAKRPAHAGPAGEHPGQRDELDDQGSATPGRVHRVMQLTADFGPAARPTDPWTSHAAATDTPGRSVLRDALLDQLRHSGPDGATDDELWLAHPDALLGSVAKRRHDLVVTGLVVNSGRTRPTRRGCPAVVWQAVEHAPVPADVVDLRPVIVASVERPMSEVTG